MAILFLWFVTPINGQTVPLPLGTPVIVPTSADYLQIDNLDNAYLINKQFQLQKINPNGSLKCTYSSSAYGPLFSVDASNPLNVLLFYKDFTTIVALDNEFSELGIHQMAFNGFTDIGAIGYAQDNNFWIFDNTTLQLKKINAAGRELAASENLFTIGLNVDERPNFILSRNNFVYVNAPKNGIYIFDLNGVYYRRIPVTELRSFQVRDNYLWYVEPTSQSLVRYDLQGITDTRYALPETTGINAVKIGRDHLFLLTSTYLAIYPLPK